MSEIASRHLVWQSPEVVYSDGLFRSVGSEIVTVLKAAAAKSERRRCRLCFHGSPEARQQEMLIVMHRDSYVQPHRHIGKVETLMVAEGAAETLLFDELGHLAEVIPMTAPGGVGHFFYRMPERAFHTLRFQSEWFVFVETTIGPFSAASSERAPWAPPESDPLAGHAYLASLVPRQSPVASA